MQAPALPPPRWQPRDERLLLAALREPTSAELRAIRSRWLELWGDGLSDEQLQAEEASLDALPYAAACRRHYVIDAPGAPLAASCEVFLLPSTTAAPGDGCSWLLRSLWTPPSGRGCGYASALVRAVAAAAARAGASSVILFSDIGPAFYEFLGFSAARGHQLVDVELDAIASAAGRGASCDVEDIGLEALTAAGGGGGLQPLRLSPPPGAASSWCAVQTDAARLAWLVSLETLRAAAGLQAPLCARGAA